jgi:hypothetical protein
MATMKLCGRKKRRIKPEVLPVERQKSRGGGDTPTKSDSSEEEEGGGNSASLVSTTCNPSAVW